LAAIEGHEAEAFVLPTGIFVSLRRSYERPPVHRMTRVTSWSTNLSRLVLIDEIFNDVAARTCTIADARERLRHMGEAEEPYTRWQKWCAAGLSSAAAGIFFRGGLLDALAAGIAGVIIFGLALPLQRLPQGRFLLEFLGGSLAAVAGLVSAIFVPGTSREVVVLAGVIGLVPGMTLTTSLAELTQKNLVSGAARLMEAFITLLSLAGGIALTLSLEQMLHLPPIASAERVGLGLGFQLGALVASALSFGVVLNVPRHYMGAALASGGLSYAVTFYATQHLPAHVASFVAALAVAVFANASARLTERPAQLFQIPGMMLLVPGSFGFLSFGEFLRDNFMGGAAKAFEMLLIGAALVMGVLVGSVFMPARKLL
jgi:uncharacterized membrane protein YjjP (DUF1212 family)